MMEKTKTEAILHVRKEIPLPCRRGHGRRRSGLERAFIRIQEVNGRFCCGKAVFAYYRLVLVVDGKEWGDIMSEDEKAMDDALAAIAARSSATAIGFVK